MSTTNDTHATTQSHAPNTAHTPGPWRAQPIEGPGHWQVINESCRQVAMARHWPNSHGVNSEDARAETEANARLIAAAPELLAALENCFIILRYLASNGKPIDQRTIEQARAALAAAQGGAK